MKKQSLTVQQTESARLINNGEEGPSVWLTGALLLDTEESGKQPLLQLKIWTGKGWTILVLDGDHNLVVQAGPYPRERFAFKAMKDALKRKTVGYWDWLAPKEGELRDALEAPEPTPEEDDASKPANKAWATRRAKGDDGREAARKAVETRKRNEAARIQEPVEETTEGTDGARNVEALNAAVPELMGRLEVARELGVEPTNLDKVVGVPEPIPQELRRGALWRADVIREFAEWRRSRLVRPGMRARY